MFRTMMNQLSSLTKERVAFRHDRGAGSVEWVVYLGLAGAAALTIGAAFTGALDPLLTEFQTLFPGAGE